MQWTRDLLAKPGAKRIAGLTAVLVGVGAIATILISRSNQTSDASYQLEAVDSPGANPFAPPAGTDQRGATPPANTGGTFTASTAGLYGGTEDVSSCDSGKLVAFLQAHPDKAAAWAQVLGIGVGDIGQYVSGLTPVILRSDTYVTNHGFENGRATTIPAVLQAGTAVLVDKYGAPVTKCFCGNPLTAPVRYSNPEYVGAPWEWFSDTNITVVRGNPVAINEFTLVEPQTGDSFDRPVGTDGGEDRRVSTGPGPTSATVPPSSTTSPSTGPSTGPPTSPTSPTGTASPSTGPPTSPIGTASPFTSRPGGATTTTTPGPGTATTTPGPGTTTTASPSDSSSPGGPSTTTSPSASSAAAALATSAVGDCYVDGGAAHGIVNVRNNDTTRRHSYEVAVAFESGGAGSASVADVAPGQTGSSPASGSGGSAPDGRIGCEITSVVDEDGHAQTAGGLPRPPDTHPLPTSSSAPPTTSSTPPTTEPESTTTEPSTDTSEPDDRPS